MKVLLVNDLPEEGWKSMDRYSQEVYEGLNQFNSLHAEMFWYEYNNSNPACLSVRATKLFRKYVFYPLGLIRRRADIFHILDHSYAHLVPYLKTKHQKVVINCFDLAGFHHWEGSKVSEIIYKTYGIWGLKCADYIVTPSYSTKLDIIHFVEYLSERIKVVPLGVSQLFRPLDRGQAKKKQFFEFGSHSPKVILHVGSSAKRKNIEILLHVLHCLRADFGLDVYLLKVGSHLTQSQEQLSQSLGIRPYVKVLKNISDDDLVLIYNFCDVFLFPSVIEGFGLPILEAMACGLPVVCSNSSSLPEVASDAAVQVAAMDVRKMTEAVFEVLTKPDLYSSLREKGLKRARMFTWEKHIEGLLKIYCELGQNNHLTRE